MKIKVVTILIIISLFHIVNNSIVLHQDQSVPVYDRASHILSGYEIYKDYNIVSPHGLQKAYSYFYNIAGGYYPPFFYLTSAPLFYLVALNSDFALYANILYLFILMFSVYGIGKNLYDSKVGVLSAFVVSMFPGIFAFSRVAFLELPLTAMVTLSIFLLLSTEHFRKRWLSFLFGLSIGLGMLTKWSFVVYVIGVLVYYVFISIKDNPEDRKKFLLNISLALFIAFIVSAPWYIANAIKLIKNILLISTWEGAYTGKPLLFHLLFYIRSLYLYQMYPFLFLLFTPLFFKHLIRKKWVIVLWLIAPFILFTVLTNKDVRYTMPMLPAIGIIIASEAAQLRKGILVTVCSFLLFQFFLLSYLPTSVFNSMQLRTHPFGIDFNYAEYKDSDPLFETGILFPDRRGHMRREQARQIVSVFKRHKGRDNDSLKVLFTFNIGKIYYSVLFALAQENLRPLVHCPAMKDMAFIGEFLKKDFNYDNYLLKHDIIVTKSGYKGGNGTRQVDVLGKLDKAFFRNKDSFVLIDSLENDDGSKVCIYKRI
ncbi:ArnT family glycosyltransferase [Candidatus Omnitrophota bacterium]